MNDHDLKKLLQAVSRGEMKPAEALSKLRHPPVTDLEFARLDHHRELRCGFPEVVFCAGKQVEEVGRIAATLLERADRILLTRATPEMYAAVRQAFPRACHHERARAITCVKSGRVRKKGLVAVVTAGTSDIPVAEEARVTAEIMGARVETCYDVGVAGIHRILSAGNLLRRARAVVVAAGMEGALASVVGGLVARPVFAVPTSIGYGAAFQGVAALLGMLNSCAPNVSVVNIDNGFGAGYCAALVNRNSA